MAIPVADQLYVNRLRTYLNDTPELNTLLDVSESTDEELYECLLTVADEVAIMQPALKPEYALSELPRTILNLGGTLQVLTTKGILSARNTLTYRDAGGVTVQDHDKYGRYINYFNILINKYTSLVQQYKISKNISAGFGGVPSEYSL